MDVYKQINREAAYLMNQFQNGMVVLKVQEVNKYQLAFVNDAFADLLGYQKDVLQSKMEEDLLCVLYPADYTKVINVFRRARQKDISDWTFRLLDCRQNVLWVLGHYKVGQIKGETYVFISVTNIQEYVTNQNQLGLSENMWTDIVNSIPIGLLIFSIDQEKTSVIAVNEPLVAFSNVIGEALDGNHRDWSAQELMLLFNQSIYCFCEDEDIPLVRRMLEESEMQSISDCTFRLRGSSEENPIWIYSSCCSKPTGDGRRNYYVSFQNDTEDETRKRELKENHEILLNLSYFDTLTGARSRNAYNQFIEECKKSKLSKVGIAFADVNGLKNINDTLGHLQGDHMIQSFAQLLIKRFGADNVFRISGDEFVVIVSDTDKNVFRQNMQQLLMQVKAYDDIASIGYIWKENVSDIKRRVSQAEQLMYLEKKKFYEEERSLFSKHRSKLLGELLYDLEMGRYEMFLQPKSNIKNQKVIGAEALARKRGPKGELIPPYEFIPQLEQEKLISFIDFFMLEEVCRFLEMLHEEGNTSFKISVNMSRVTMAENDYIQRIIEISDKYHFCRRQLEFEITESSQTMDNMRMEEDVLRLKELGFGISLDDVGTEYSSIPMLTLEGIDTVKLDRSFIVKMTNPKVDKLISYVIEMSHGIGLDVVAEGVETDGERKKLEQKKCDMYQGFLLSKPIPAAEFKEKFLS